ncbi:MAG TPA: glycosyltransferase family 2 protein [Chryseolinea sp.]|nr:glycosyltransferase family 2 protein [Chryseolinea sp.]
MGSETVTVIIPLYNREQKIARAVESVLGQTYPNFKLIVVDDCSTDGSLAVVNGFKDDRLFVMKTSLNAGAAAARNVGIKVATSRYIALLDSDDKYHCDFLRLSVEYLQGAGTEYGFSYTGYGRITDALGPAASDTDVWRLPDRFSGNNRPFLYQLQIGSGAGILAKKEVFQKVGLFDELFLAAEDTDWFIRVSEYYKGLPIPKKLVLIDNSSEDRLTSNYAKNAAAYKKIIVKHRDIINSSSFLIRRWYYKSMWLHYYSGDKAQAARDHAVLRELGQGNLMIFLIYLAGKVLSRNLFINVHRQLARLK